MGPPWGIEMFCSPLMPGGSIADIGIIRVSYCMWLVRSQQNKNGYTQNGLPELDDRGCEGAGGYGVLGVYTGKKQKKDNLAYLAVHPFLFWLKNRTKHLFCIFRGTKQKHVFVSYINMFG